LALLVDRTRARFGGSSWASSGPRQNYEIPTYSSRYQNDVSNANGIKIRDDFKNIRDSQSLSEIISWRNARSWHSVVGQRVKFSAPLCGSRFGLPNTPTPSTAPLPPRGLLQPNFHTPEIPCPAAPSLKSHPKWPTTSPMKNFKPSAPRVSRSERRRPLTNIRSLVGLPTPSSRPSLLTA
jgi:hypothetical protein